MGKRAGQQAKGDKKNDIKMSNIRPHNREGYVIQGRLRI